MLLNVRWWWVHSSWSNFMNRKPRDLDPYLFTLLPNTHFKMKQEIVINILRSTGIHFFLLPETVGTVWADKTLYWGPDGGFKQSYIYECRMYIQIHEYVTCPLNYNYSHDVMHILINKRGLLRMQPSMWWSKAFLLPDAPAAFCTFWYPHH